MSRILPRLLSASCLALGATGAALAQTADLSLALDQPDATPARYSDYEVTATVTNDGPDAATGVVVSLPRPDGVVSVGGDEFVASQGRYRPYSSREWSVGTLAAGQSATLTLNLFLLDATAPDYYGQVVASGTQDPDSTPGNGAPGSVNEDDEASVQLGTGGASATGADLSLAFSDDGDDAAAFDTYAVTLALRNDGPETATGVVVSVPFAQSQGAVFVGGNEAEASQGRYRPYSTQLWRVGEVAAGATATLTLNFFRLEGELAPLYAQVKASDQDDPDSTPGNGTAPAVNEDDEARAGGDDDNTGGDDDCDAFVTDLGSQPNFSRFSNVSAEESADGFVLTVNSFNEATAAREERTFTLSAGGDLLATGGPTAASVMRVSLDGSEIVVTTDGQETSRIPFASPAPADAADLREVVRDLGDGRYLVTAAYLDAPGARTYTLSGTVVDPDGTQGASAVYASGLSNRVAFTEGSLYETGRGGFVIAVQDVGASVYFFIGEDGEAGSVYRDEYRGRPRFVQAVGPGPNGTVTIVDQLEGSNSSLPLGILRVDPATGTLVSRGGASGSDVRARNGAATLVLADGTVVSQIGNDLQFDAPGGATTTLGLPEFSEFQSVARTSDGGFLALASRTGEDGAPTDDFVLVRFDASLSPYCEGEGPIRGADLVTEITEAPTVRDDDSPSVSFRYEISNVGNQSAAVGPGAIEVQPFVSTDRELSDDDIAGRVQLGFPELGAGQRERFRGSINLPSGLASGEYFLILKIDPNDVVAETDEGNNLDVIAFSYDGGAGGAQTQTLHVSPNPATSGAELHVSLETLTETAAADAGDRVEVRITDAYGRAVFSQSVDAALVADRFDVGGLGLSAGWYVVSVVGADAPGVRVLVRD